MRAQLEALTSKTREDRAVAQDENSKLQERLDNLTQAHNELLEEFERAKKEASPALEAEQQESAQIQELLQQNAALEAEKTNLQMMIQNLQKTASRRAGPRDQPKLRPNLEQVRLGVDLCRCRDG